MEYRHPQIDHTFTIKDIDINTIEIDGVRITKRDFDGLVTMSNHNGYTASLGDLTLVILQHVLAYNFKLVI
jgi:hypothetical protein